MTDSSDTPDKPKVTIVSWLARQKEVIVLIMFFVGGVVFLYVNFVTQNQIKVLTCSLGVQVKLLAESADLRERQRQRAMLTEQIFIMSLASADLSDHEKELLAHLRKSEKAEADAATAINGKLAGLTEELGKC